MNRIPVIAFKGRGGSGKTTAAKHLIGKGYGRTSFAAPMRAMLEAIGLFDEELSGRLKESPCKILSGRTPREALQLLGTEWGRGLSPDLWVNLWRTRAMEILARGYRVVVDDCRFENEAALVRSLGGFVIEIALQTEFPYANEVPALYRYAGRREPVGLAGHASEMQSFDPDITVINDGRNLAAFHAAIDEALDVLAQPAYGEAA